MVKSINTASICCALFVLLAVETGLTMARHIAFYNRVPGRGMEFKKCGVIKFPTSDRRLIVNYDKTTGIFTPERNGLYMIIITLRILNRGDTVEAFLKKDGHIYTKMTWFKSHNNEPEQQTMTALISLGRGNKIWVSLEGRGEVDALIIGHQKSVFGGYRINTSG